MDDLISRQDAIDKAIMIPVARIVTEDKVIWRKAVFVEDIEALPSAQPEQDDNSEFWRKCAEQYHDMCFDLVNKINQGIQVDSIAISEAGIVFNTSPSAQSEIIRCKDCKWWRDTDHTCKEHSIVSPMGANEYCSRGKRKEDGNG